jgi:hypothetical protein
MNSIRRILWALTAFSSFVAALLFLAFMESAKSAPQEAAGAAIALGCAIIPYVFTRAIDELANLES